MPKYTISGKIISQNDQKALAGLAIEAWDKDLLFSDLVGKAITDKNGNFKISFEQSYFKELFTDRNPDLFFRIYRDGILIRSTESDTIWNLESSATKLLIVVPEDSGTGTHPGGPGNPGDGSEEKLISGKLTYADGTPVKDAIVKAFLIKIRSEELIGQSQTDANGKYIVRHSYDFVDLIVRASKDKTELASSRPYFNLSTDLIVDLVVDNKELTGPSEFSKIISATAEALEGIAITSLTPDEINTLAGKTGFNTERLRIFVAAYRMAEKYNLSAELLFALLYDGKQRSLISIASQTAALILRSIKKAVAANRISEQIQNAVLVFIETLKIAGAKELLQDGGLSSLKNVLEISSFSANEKQVTAVLYLGYASDPAGFWEKLAAVPGFEQGTKIKELHQLILLRQITGNHLPLMVKLKTMILNDSSPDFIGWNKTVWLNFLQENKTGAPGHITGESDSEKLVNYAYAIIAEIEKIYASKRTSKQLVSVSENQDLGKFFSIATDFDLGKTNISTWFKNKKDQLAGQVQDIDALEKELKTWQRLYRITPENSKTENMQALKTNGFESAFNIRKKNTKESFVRQYGDLLGGKDTAGKIYDNAAGITTQSLLLLGKMAGQTPGNLPAAVDLSSAVSASGDEEEAIDIPDLETLFGNQSYCECEHCRSVLSPAAYLVDLLEFLNNSDTNDDGKTPGQLLSERRPDIGYIELSCHNTNTALPYIDLVIEILENAVVLLNGGTVDYGYQTVGTTGELQAQPENSNADAWNIVADAVYPLNLPFHFYNAEGGIYLDKIGVPRHDLLRATQFTGNANEPTDKIIANVHLGISVNEKDILTGELVIDGTTYSIRDFWGESAAGWEAKLSNVEYFLDKTRLDYADLLLLLQVKWLNPDDTMVIDFSASSSACDISGAVMKYENGTALHANFFGRMHRFLRLKIKTGWSIPDLGMLMVASGQSDLNENILLFLSQVKWLKDEFKSKNLADLLSWWSPLDTSVDENDEEDRSYYDSLFQNTAVANPVEPVFALNADRNRLAIEDSGTVVALADYASYIAAALNISSSDLDLLLDELEYTELSFSVLSDLYRHASAARLLKISIEEILNLKAILPDDPFTNADASGAIPFVQSLADIRASGFSIGELDYLFRHNYDLDDKLAPSEDAIGQLLSGIQEGVIKIADENSFDSDPTGEITRTKLARLFEAEIYTELIAIISEQSLQTIAQQEVFIEANLVFLDTTEAKANLLIIDTSLSQEERIQARYTYLFSPVLDYLTDLLSVDFVAQTLSNELSIDFDTSKQMVTELIVSPSDPARFAIDDLLDETFIYYEYAEEESISSTLFPEQYNTFILLYKSAMVVRKFNLNNEEVVWIYENTASTGWLNLNAIPLVFTETATGLFASWQLMYRFSRFNEKYHTTDVSMFGLLDMALHPSDYDPAITPEIFKTSIAAYTSWEIADLDFLCGSSAFNLSVSQFANGSAFYYLQGYADRISKSGSSAESLWAWTKNDLDETDATAIKQAAKAHYSSDQWLSVAPALRDKLRKQQRDALCAYLIARGGFEDEIALLEYYLIDVEMEPGMLTSRIKQANSSAQLFIQRSFMGLESGVSLVESQQELWEWMRNYRVWEANRKVFLYPENWIEPELRDTQSEFFEDLRSELLQNEITEENVESAFVHYLEKLDEVSHINVLGTYHQVEAADENSDAIDIFHVVGRTKAYPHIYYYRNRENEIWTPWEKIDLDIEGEFLVPVVQNGRLFLFWPVFREITKDASSLIEEYALEDYAENIAEGHFYDELDDYISEELSDPFIRYEIKMAYSERKPDKWIPKRVSKESLTSEGGTSIQLYLNKIYEINQSDFCFYASSDEESANITVCQAVRFTDISGTDYNWRYELGEFSLNALTKEMVADPNGSMYNFLSFLTGFLFPADNFTIQEPDDSEQMHNSFTENSGTHDLVLYSLNDDNDYVGKEVLGLTPGTFRIPIPAQYEKFVSQDSFFYQDDDRRYFVTPKKVAVSMGYSGKSAAGDKKTAKTTSDDSSFEFTEELVTTLKYKFESFYHSYPVEFIKTINRDGIEYFMNRETQLQSEDYFASTFDPKLVLTSYPVRDIDFSSTSAFSIYNWELFFHAPMLIAGHLSQNQKFEEAQRWYHFIFNPTDRTDDGIPSPQRYWQFKPFYEEVTLSSIYEMMYALSYTGTDTATLALKEQVEAQIEAWKADPFDPHTIAAMRTTAYMKSVVMKYIDNLIAWGDSLFRQDTIESINEATQLYVLAYKILGDRPENIPQEETDPKTYNELDAIGIDAFANALVELEGYTSSSGSGSGATEESSLLLYNLYFCIPNNEKLLKYWDTVEDRLFKIRNSMNIDGVKRSLALFEPAIDPGMLIRARAAGVDLGSILSDFNAPLPAYRFRLYIQKAMQFCGDVQAMGNALLSALEKKDAEELSLLRANQELKLLEAGKDIRQMQISEARENLESLNRSKKTIEERYDYYAQIQKITEKEKQALNLQTAAGILQSIAAGAKLTSSIASLVPDFTVGVNGPMPMFNSRYGGSNIAMFSDFAADVFSIGGGILNILASNTATNASYDRRWEDWKLQERLAKKEISQIEKQIAAAEIRVEISETDFRNFELQLEQSAETYEFLSGKYTGKELYQWLSAQLSTLYFQSYQLAYDCAKHAQRNFQYELGLSQSYIQYGYWDSLKKGLLAGEKLNYDLKRMEMAYYEQNKRGYEISKNISLLALDPAALLALRQNGECYIELPEAIFDLDYPGQYMRRIKSVALTIPCIAGPYTGMNCTLTLLENRFRQEPDATDGYAETEADSRFVYNQASVQSIATSTGRNDSGVFQLNFEDERYLPFEGAGAISRWKVQLPDMFRAFDYNSISDLVIHLNYQSKDGGEMLKETVLTELQTQVLAMVSGSGATGLSRMFSMRNEYSGDWYRFLNPPATQEGQAISADAGSDKFPYMFRGFTIQVTAVSVCMLVDPSVLGTSTSLNATITYPSASTAAISLKPDENISGMLTAELTGLTENVGDFGFSLTSTDIPTELAASGTPVRLDTDLVYDLVLICQYKIV